MFVLFFLSSHSSSTWRRSSKIPVSVLPNERENLFSQLCGHTTPTNQMCQVVSSSVSLGRSRATVPRGRKKGDSRSVRCRRPTAGVLWWLVMLLLAGDGRWLWQIRGKGAWGLFRVDAPFPVHWDGTYMRLTKPLWRWCSLAGDGRVSGSSLKVEDI